MCFIFRMEKKKKQEHQEQGSALKKIFKYLLEKMLEACFSASKIFINKAYKYVSGTDVRYIRRLMTSIFCLLHDTSHV